MRNSQLIVALLLHNKMSFFTSNRVDFMPYLSQYNSSESPLNMRAGTIFAHTPRTFILCARV
jgi:hypothetical protein